MKWSGPAWAAALTTATACGPSATGTGYQGDPLFTITGQMVTRGEAPTLPIRLAVAWYADHATLGGPQAIVTQDVQYRGTFPLDYTFSFYGPPPTSALDDTSAGGVSFRGAWGVLIAYEDLNGDGRLDTIPTGDSPIDRILATSIGDLFNGADAGNPTRVAYVDGPPPATLPGFSPGYNLYTGQNIALPQSTPVELDLGNGAGPTELDLFVCPDFVTGQYLTSPNSAAHSAFDLPCNIPPTGGVRVAGSFLVGDEVPSAWIRVTDGTNPLPGAQVAIDGAPLTYVPVDGVFEGSGSGFSCGDAGSDRLTVALPGDPSIHAFRLPRTGDFSIVSPSSNGTHHFLAGSPIPVSWTASVPPAGTYTLSLISTLAPYGDDLQRQIAPASDVTQSGTLQAPDVDGPEWLTVYAAQSDQPIFGLGGSVLYPGTYRSVRLDLAPADAGLTASGQVQMVRDYRLQTGSSAFVNVYDGDLELSAGASVAVDDGGQLNWSDARAAFFGTGEFRTSVVSDIQATVPGLSVFDAQVPIPGDFAIDNPPGSVAPAQLLNLTWTPADGAAGYFVSIGVSDGGNNITLASVSTTSNTASLVVPTQTGRMLLAVDALGDAGNRHFTGLVENQVDIEVSSQ